MAKSSIFFRCCATKRMIWSKRSDSLRSQERSSPSHVQHQLAQYLGLNEPGAFSCELDKLEQDWRRQLHSGAGQTVRIQVARVCRESFLAGWGASKACQKLQIASCGGRSRIDLHWKLLIFMTKRKRFFIAIHHTLMTLSVTPMRMVSKLPIWNINAVPH